MATLYIVGTPIGNLEDITLRALKTLSTVDVILCEDTRVTKKLLDRHSIATATLSYHSHSTLSRVSEIMGMLREGKNLALVSDAGTPGISDPGSELLRRIYEECREEIKKGEIKIESVPGPSALALAISLAGMPGSEFTFLGFLPHKKGRETLFNEIRAADRTMMFYESPHRILKSLESLKNVLDSERLVVVCRELTKVFEEVVRGSALQVFEHFLQNEEKVRGEFVVLVEKK